MKHFCYISYNLMIQKHIHLKWDSSSISKMQVSGLKIFKEIKD